jgi:hypothetical protein
MWVIEIIKYPNKKRKAISVYDTKNPVTHYTIGYINHNEDLFKKALEDSRHIMYIYDIPEDTLALTKEGLPNEQQ